MICPRYENYQPPTPEQRMNSLIDRLKTECHFHTTAEKINPTTTNGVEVRRADIEYYKSLIIGLAREIVKLADENNP